MYSSDHAKLHERTTPLQTAGPASCRDLGGMHVEGGTPKFGHQTWRNARGLEKGKSAKVCDGRGWMPTTWYNRPTQVDI